MSKVFAKLLFSRKINGEKCEIDVTNQTFTIGRSQGCSLEIPEKHLSGRHCSLEFCDDGQVYLSDTSSNGTFIDKERVKNKRTPIAFGTVVYLIKKANEPEKNLFFTLKMPEFQEDLDQTVVYSPSETKFNDSTCIIPENDNAGTDNETQILPGVDKSDVADVEFTRREGSQGPPVFKKPRLIRVADEPVVDQSSSENGDKTKVSSEDTKPKQIESTTENDSKSSKYEDAIAETLMCSICCEIIHDCISLQPCGHCFCAGCYSDWMSRSRHCPECRLNVERLSKNHRINNLIEAYLKEHPNKKRSDEELKELDLKNKVTKDMAYPKKQKKTNAAATADDDDDDSDAYYSSTDSDDEADNPPRLMNILNPPIPVPFPFIPPRPIIQPPNCIQCPTYGQVPAVGFVLRPATRIPPNFVCQPFQNHILCLCCHNPMPDRRHDRTCPVAIECSICKRPYCNLYFGCSRPACTGCLNKFKEMNFGNAVLPLIINENPFESQILQNYLTGKHLLSADLLKECLTKLDNGEYSCRDKFAHGLTSETVICFSCATNNFRDLAYEYRKNIPKEDLPENVTSRQDCWYGRNCRSQKNNPQHSARLNHVCDQTRF